MCVQTITVSQEITGGGTGGTVNIGHAASGITAGTYGDATHVPKITVDNEGHVTAVTPTVMTPAAANVTGLATVAITGHASDLIGIAAIGLSGSASDLVTGTVPVGVLPASVPIAGTLGPFLQPVKATGTITAAGVLTFTGISSTVDNLPATPTQGATAFYTPPANAVLMAATIKETTAFAGPSLSSLVATITDSTGGLSLTSANMHLSGSSITASNANDSPGLPAAVSSIRISLSATGCNLSQLTAGAFEVQLLLLILQ